MNPVCTNCGASLVEVYCAHCGEKQPHHHDLTVGHFAHDAMHELVHLDGKLWGTLRDLVRRPALLTAEYFAGRKKRYIAPLRLFLTLFALQFLAYTLYKPAAVYSLDAFVAFDRAGGLQKTLERLAEKRKMPLEVYKERIEDKWRKNLSLMQLGNVIGIALVLKVLYWRRYLVEHIVFSAHLLSFGYVLSLIIWPVYAIAGYAPGPLTSSVGVVSGVVTVVYTFLALRRFYPASRAKTTFKTVLVFGGYYLVNIFFLSAALAAALFTVR